MISCSTDSVTFENGTTLGFDSLWSNYPQRAPDFCADSKLTNPKGFVPVNVQTNAVVGKDGVWAIGDACLAMMPVPNKPHPKAGGFAHLMGIDVANTVDAFLQGKPAVVPTGRVASCVAETGSGAGIAVSPNVSAVLADPTTGKPSVTVTPFPTGEDVKIAWIDGFVKRFFGADQGFSPASAESA